MLQILPYGALGAVSLGEEAGDMVDVKHLAWLSRLRLDDAEAKELQKRLDSMRKLIDKLLAAPTTDVEPLYHPLEAEGKLRDDTPAPGLSRDEALSNAAKTEKGYVVAPRTVEE